MDEPAESQELPDAAKLEQMARDSIAEIDRRIEDLQQKRAKTNENIRFLRQERERFSRILPRKKPVRAPKEA